MRALLSVYDKTGLVELAQGLDELGWNLVSSGGTSKALAEAGIPHQQVDAVTGAPAMLDGRVKTLHPNIHGGILADRSKPEHMTTLQQRGIEPIDFVVSNLYPFESSPSIEMIDVGGPTMVRAAAKNHASVGIVVDPADYGPVLEELRANGELSDATRRRLARQAFAHTAAYDAAIVGWLDQSSEQVLPPSIHLTLQWESRVELRYGENPHQKAAVYSIAGELSWLDSLMVLSNGLQLGYLNVYDADAAWRLVCKESRPCVAIIKHANPCGVGVAADLAKAYGQAYACDEKSAFGGIVALNRVVDEATARLIVLAAQADVIIAPGYATDVVEMLTQRRKNTRILQADPVNGPVLDYRQIDGAFLVQEAPYYEPDTSGWKVVTKRQPTAAEWEDARMAWWLQDGAKSNSIILVEGKTAWGIGVGQQNRHDSARLAVEKAAGRARGGAASSDAFFPFRDGLDEVAKAGVAVVIQPGGSVRDQEVIDAANEHDIAMVFTGERHFRH